MKLYELLKVMNLRHSEEFNDYENIRIIFVDGNDVEVVPNTLRAILRFADCYIDSISLEGKIEIIITKEPIEYASMEVLKYQPYLLE